MTSQHEDTQKLIADALYGKKRRGRIQVAPKEERTADNVTFASKREMVTYLELKASLKAGILRDLELQPRFPLVVNGVKICEYRADFKTIDKDGKVSVIDAKGMRTEVYKLKKKLFEVLYLGLRIVEV